MARCPSRCLRMAPQLLLRQVVQHHGRCVPPFRFGRTLEWLHRLPSGEVLNALENCTVVLPRLGDGWYAPPTSSGYEAPAGFPWGELTDTGAEQMRRRGAALAASGHPASTWTTDAVLVRATNRRPSIGSAQAMVWGALDPPPADGSDGAAGTSTRPQHSRLARPVEVLLTQGEDLLPQVAPGLPEYPKLSGSAADAFSAMEDQIACRREELIGALEKNGCHDASSAHVVATDWDTLCEALMCLEGSGIALGPGTDEAAAAIKQFNFLRWAAPLEAAGMEASIRTVQPLLRDVLAACDASLLTAPPSGEHSGALVVYLTQADALAAMLGVLGFAGTYPLDSRGHRRWQWPTFGSSLQIELLRSDGDTYVKFSASGLPVFHDQGSAPIFPYSPFRSRVLDAFEAET